MIYQREPVFTIGQAPFVAGAIHVRNQIRVLKQREKARRRKALVERFPLAASHSPTVCVAGTKPRSELATASRRPEWRSEPDWHYGLARDCQGLARKLIVEC